MELARIRPFAHKHCRFKLRNGKEVYGVIWEVQTHDSATAETPEDRLFFASVRDYAYDESSKCPKESQWHNLVFNARAFGSAGVSSKWRLRHPLERLMRAMPLLLWDGAEGRNYSLVASCLDVLSSITSPVAAYECLWRRLKGTVLPA